MNVYYVAGIPVSDNYLAHHGIKGQKWGVRRYQYSNGSLTPEGIKRYRHHEPKQSKEDKMEDAFYRVAEKEGWNWGHDDSWRTYDNNGDVKIEGLAKRHNIDTRFLLDIPYRQSKEKEEYDNARRKYKELDAFSSNKRLKGRGANKELAKADIEETRAFRRYHKKIADTAYDEIQKMPEKDRDAAMAYIADYLYWAL